MAGLDETVSIHSDEKCKRRIGLAGKDLCSRKDPQSRRSHGGISLTENRLQARKKDGTGGGDRRS